MAETFEDLRPLLFSIAYRMLGSVSEAEDVVQEAFLRYHRALPSRRRDRVAQGLPVGGDDPACIDQLRSARVRSESYVGEWLPEPLLTDGPPATPPGTPRTPTRSRWRSCSCSSGSRRWSAPSSCCTTSSATATTRSPASSARARTTAVSSRCGPGGTSTSRSRGSRRRGGSARSWPGGSSAPSRTVTWTGWSSCSPPTSSSTATAAARARRGANPIVGRDRVAGCCSASAADSASSVSPCGAPRSTASPARLFLDPAGRLMHVMTSTSPTGGADRPVGHQPRQAAPPRPARRRARDAARPRGRAPGQRSPAKRGMTARRGGFAGPDSASYQKGLEHPDAVILEVPAEARRLGG